MLRVHTFVLAYLLFEALLSRPSILNFKLLSSSILESRCERNRFPTLSDEFVAVLVVSVLFIVVLFVMALENDDVDSSIRLEVDP